MRIRLSCLLLAFALSLSFMLQSETLEAKTIRPKALIVDYRGENSKRVTKCLRRSGFKVYHIRSLKKAKKLKVKKYDCLVIPGGHNVTPELYGAERQKETYGTDLKKDKMQIAAIKRFVKAKKPVLGICRGSQIINVALGGTLYQHLPESGWHRERREIRLGKKSWLYKTFGKREEVTHSHHQAVKKLAKGLIATAWDDEDDIIEEYKHKKLPVYAVQWHPDCMKKKGKKVFDVFKSFVIRDIKKRRPDKKPEDPIEPPVVDDPVEPVEDPQTPGGDEIPDDGTSGQEPENTTQN